MMEILIRDDYIAFDNNAAAIITLLQTEHCKVLMINFLPGQALPPHRHPGKHVLFRVESGEISLECGTNRRIISPEQWVWVHGDDLMGLRNESDREVVVSLFLHS